MEPILIESRLVAATVYGDRARLCREGLTDLSAGVACCVFPDLPADLDPSVVQVETDHGRILAVDSETPSGESSPAAESDADSDPSVDRQRLAAKQDALRAELELLEHISPPKDAAASALDPNGFMSVLRTVTDRHRTTLEELRATSDAHAAASVAAEAAARASSGRRLRITVETDSPGTARLRVTYPGGWATWRPLYHLHMTSGADRAELVRYADVWQRTGEDWKTVGLKLSTSNARRGLRLPSITPWRLALTPATEDLTHLLERRARPPGDTDGPPDVSTDTVAAALTLVPPEAKGNMPTIEVEAPQDFGDATDFEPVFADALAPPPTGAPPVGALPDSRAEPLSDGTVEVELEVTRPFDGRSGDDQHRVQLGRKTYPVQIWYLLWPALRDHAFGRAEVTNEDASPILAGAASLFIDGRFCGHSRLAPTQPQDKLPLDIGAETAITCIRKTDAQVRQGDADQNEVQAVDVTIEVESRLDVPVNVRVQDQVPVATDNDVRVRLLSTDPSDAELDKTTGMITFSIRVEPGAKRALKLSYEIGGPAGYRLQQSFAQGVSS